MKKIHLSLIISCVTIINSFAQGPCQISLTSIAGSDNQTLCKNTSLINITYQVSGGGATVSATLPDGLIANYNIGPGKFTISGNPTVEGTFDYTVTTNGTCSAQSSLTGTIIVNPSPTIVVNNQTVCAGTPATLTANGGLTYSWSNGTNGATMTDSPTATTNYTVTGTGQNGSCSSSAIGTITVNPTPVITVSNTTICSGSSGATLTANGVGATTYIWSPGGSTGQSIIVNPTTTTSYTVSGQNMGCVGNTIATVNVNTTPVISATSANICVGQTAQLIATASTVSTLTWSPGGTVGSSLSTTPTISTTYTVTGTTGMCFGQAIATVTVSPGPVITASLATICAGDAVKLQAMGSSGTAYIWSNNSTGASIVVTPNISTSYQVTGTINGCSATAKSTVTVLQNNCTPKKSPLNLSVSSQDVSNNSVCDGTGYVNVAGGVPPYSILFLKPLTIAAGPNIKLPNLCAGFYNVKASDANSDTTSFTFVIGSPATTFIDPNPTLKDSTVVDTLFTDALANCNINYDFINTISIGDYSYIGFDTVRVMWTIVHSGGTTNEWVEYKYGSPGVYTLLVGVFCPNRAPASITGVDQLYIDGKTVGIKTIDKLNISVYPNPFNNLINVVVAKTCSVKITNIIGSIVYSGTVNSGSTSIETGSFNSGVYFITISSADGSVTKKIIKN